MKENVRTVLIVCGVIGAIVGLCHPELQDAVEVAQVQGGVVPFDATNPFSIFAMRLWSLQLQVPALMLHWGVSERVMSAVMSAAMGMLSFQALGMTVLVAGGRTSIACLAPAVIVALGLARGGIVYPVILFDTVYTWGAIGLSLTLLTVALLSVGSLGLGALLLGLLPAMHAGLGATAWAVVGLVALMSPSLRADLWSVRRWIVLGVVITATSFGVHLMRAPAANAADAAVGSSFTDAVFRSWDLHRRLRPVRMTLLASVLIAAGFSVVIVWRRWLTPRAALLPLFVAITAAIGGALHLARALPDGTLPQWIWVLMPGRLMNFGVLSAAALAIGLGTRTAALQSSRVRLVIATVLAGIGAVYVAKSLMVAPRQWAETMDVAANDSFYARVAEGRERLLTASDISGIQRRTRRPILLNGAWIDALPYTPQSAAAINRALTAIYGVDLLNPPPNSRDGLGSLPQDTGRALWEKRSIDDWRALGREWHIDQIVTYESWQLSLPKASTGHGLTLYVIPTN